MAGDLRTPKALPALLMVVAGAAWGVYTLVGRGAVDPLAMTARNFVGAAPAGLLAWGLAALQESSSQAAVSSALSLEPSGLALAVASGAVTSGLGYAIWYAALPHLSRISAGVAMMMVPPVTTGVAALVLGEAVTPRLALAALLVLSGVVATIVGKRG